MIGAGWGSILILVVVVLVFVLRVVVQCAHETDDLQPRIALESRCLGSCFDYDNGNEKLDSSAKI
jgi:hypothetical protein